ncbi:MAG TPA: hypothetical protein VHB79_10480 [Polyangiaceae bacterium]|nr:hypothetical protein [Polyangiaceae bacterium]
MAVTQVGERKRGRWVGFGSLLISSSALVAFACSGEPFCDESRTCLSEEPGAAGQAGASSNDGEAGSDSVREGGANSGGSNSSASNAGAGGEPPSTIGNACAKDAECDDKDSCNGTEKCVDSVCTAGQAVKCPAGLACSAKQNDACVFPSAAPWIVYAADADTSGVVEAYGVKSDLLDTMKPVKLSPQLASGWQVTAIGNWSPDGSAAIITVSNTQLKHVDSYLIRFDDKLPTAAIFLTEGMSASAQSGVTWSASGKTLVIRRDDGVHALSVASDGSVTQSLATSSSYAVDDAWIKNDDELLFYGKNIPSSKVGFYLATRGPSSWSQKLIAEVPSVAVANPTPDGALLGYLTIDQSNYQQTVWVVETMAASQPQKLAGPASDMVFSASADASQLLLAVTNGATGKTNVSGGTRAQLLALPSVKTGVVLAARDVIPYSPGTPWSPDSSRAWAFQESAVGKQLVIYQPSEAEKWHPLPSHQLKTDANPIWSPDSTVLALPTKTAADSAISLTLVSSPDYVAKDVDQTVSAGFIKMLGFSAGREFFAYAKGTGGPATDGYYLDLRNGVAKAPAPLPIDDPVDSLRFASTGTAALYSRAGKKDCNYIDFGASVPDSVSSVNDGKPVVVCSFQPLLK